MAQQQSSLVSYSIRPAWRTAATLLNTGALCLVRKGSVGYISDRITLISRSVAACNRRRNGSDVRGMRSSRLTAAALGPVVAASLAMPLAGAQPAPLRTLAPQARSVVTDMLGTVVGHAWRADNSPLPQAHVRLRDVRTGRAVANTVADDRGPLHVRARRARLLRGRIALARGQECSGDR